MASFTGIKGAYQLVANFLVKYELAREMSADKAVDDDGFFNE